MAVLFDSGIFSVILPNSAIAEGATFAWYASGSSTPLTTYSDEGLTTPNDNPVTVDANGRIPPIWLQNANYKLVFTPISGTTITRDPISGIDAAANLRASLAADNGADLIGASQDENATPGTLLDHYKRFICVTDAPYLATGDGTTNDAPAFLAAVAALPANGGTIWVPDNVGYKLDSEITTGTKKVAWIIGQTTITCPANGGGGLRLKSNGSSLRGAGPDATIFKLRTPTTAVTYPSVVTALSAGAVSTATPSGGSGIVTTPVTLPSNSADAGLTSAPDALLIATISGGTVSAITVAAGGSGYTGAPTVSFIGGGAAAVIIDGVQNCEVSGFSVDFQKIDGSVGVLHRGGWWANIHDIRTVYDVTSTGSWETITSESATSIGILVDSYTLGAPGPNGSYGGSYVSRYANLKFSKRAIIGHDTSKATTLQWDTCDFNSSYLHLCIAVTDINVVHQGNSGAFYDLGAVDGLTMLGGDREGSAIWYHIRAGSCSNIRDLGVNSYAGTGSIFRGQVNSGYFNPAKANSADFPLDIGSLTAGADFQNFGYLTKHRIGIPFDGDVYVAAATNIRPISLTQGTLDDVTKGGVVVFTGTSQFIIKRAAAGANPVPLVTEVVIDSNGMSIFNLPTVAGASKSLWYDAADSNRVKYVP